MKLLSVLTSCAFILITLRGAYCVPMEPLHLRCENLVNPLVVDVQIPRFSWQMHSDVRGERQTAYQIQAAGTRNELNENKPNLWDSGKEYSPDCLYIPWGGKRLTSQQDCWWRVRLWDMDGHPTKWSEPAHFMMGLLHQDDWKGEWIGLPADTPASPLKSARWIWYPEGNPAKSAPGNVTRIFQKRFTLPEGAIKSAEAHFTADNSYVLYVNGKKALSGDDYHQVQSGDIAGMLKSGENIITADAKNVGDTPNPAGFIGNMHIVSASGSAHDINTDGSWEASKSSEGTPEWVSAKELGPHGMSPWEDVHGSETRILPARYLRREFAVAHPVKRVIVWMSGIGLSELYINGKRIGDAVLSPGLTEYDKRVLYVAYDVTKDVQEGRNAIGVILGNGRFYAPRLNVPIGTRDFGLPRLLLQMRVEYDGGAAEIISDTDWKGTSEGPIRANNEYDGEVYDARMELKDWSDPGYDDKNWREAEKMNAPGGVMSAQMTPPIRVVQHQSVASVREVGPGDRIYDMGQNMVGWCNIQFTGVPGQRITLRHAETLKADGSLYITNLRSATQTDEYICRGGAVNWSPRFTYHGFRYVEVISDPPLTSIQLQGCVVHDDLEAGGVFHCSDPLLNHIWSNILWGVRGNYRSIPTDCPQRDERQGWLGDRSEESRGESYLYDIMPFYAKWMTDIQDSQRADGCVPDVAPAYWRLYNDGVTWPSSFLIIPGTLYDQYGDLSVIAKHYDAMKKWILHMNEYMQDGLMPRDTYGDWCVPPEEPHLIHSQDPARQTNGTLIGTAYYIHDLDLMARYAVLLGKPDANEFLKQAASMKAAFNRVFLKTENGYYDNGTQTSCVLALVFDLVPKEYKEKVLNRLLEKIEVETKDHIGTGLIGGQWLMRTLTKNGHGDLAVQLALNKTYPSWGYMVENGATTIWELWNGNTADPAMNSGNHVMLIGDLNIWLYEYLGGIRALEPGFREILLDPIQPEKIHSADVKWNSPYGAIVSNWKKEANSYIWDITVPANTTAEVRIPAKSEEGVTEGGKPITSARGIRFLRMEKNRAILEVESGSYRFHSSL